MKNRRMFFHPTMDDAKQDTTSLTNVLTFVRFLKPKSLNNENNETKESFTTCGSPGVIVCGFADFGFGLGVVHNNVGPVSDKKKPVSAVFWIGIVGESLQSEKERRGSIDEIREVEILEKVRGKGIDRLKGIGIKKTEKNLRLVHQLSNFPHIHHDFVR